MEKEFAVKRSREQAIGVVGRDETLVGLFPDSPTEIVERCGNRKTTRTRYRALGREGVATFHFTFEPDGDVRFEKVCDGNVWRRLVGRMSFRERSGSTRVRIEMEGRTKTLVPEFTIKGPMQDQIEQMARALKQCIEAGG